MARLIPRSLTATTDRPRAIPAMISCAIWHWRQQRLLFLLMSLGMIGQIFLVCLLPALMEVAPATELRLRLTQARLPLFSIAFQTLMLLFFFMHLMARALVERQADTLAVLHHRGASVRQMLGSLLPQSTGAALFACLVSPPLAYLSAATLFPGRQLLQTFWHNPLPFFLHTWLYAAGTMLLSLGIIVATLYYTLRRTMPRLHQEMVRESEPPHKEQVKLEILLVLIGLSTYVLLLGLVRSHDSPTPPSFPLMAPLAPTLLLVCILPLSLRGIALLSMVGIHIMQPGYATTTMLAALHRIRSPRVLARMTILLVLAITLAIFALIFTASQERRINDIAAYKVGADFSGTLTTTSPSIEAVADPYRHMRGTTSVTIGAITSAISDDVAGDTIQIQAIDAATFAETALWPRQNPAGSLVQLMEQLIDQRLMATQFHVVPAIVDTPTMQALSLHPGMTFSLYEHSATNHSARSVRYVVLASVARIPGISSGILVDYQSFLDYRLKNNLAVVPLNHIWLRTGNDEATLKYVRKTLTTSLRLDNLLDRRFLLSSLQTDPLALLAQSMLSIGAVTAALLALFGNILAIRAGTTKRPVNRALLHALETEPGRFASLLIWEQGNAYLMALLPGILIGLLLSTTFIPVLLNHLPPPSAASVDAAWYANQQVLSAQVVIPIPLGIALGLCLLLIPLALTLLLRMLSRPAFTHLLYVTDTY
jgi:FtsX-like permease family protein